jgi:Rrf2 family protein
MVSTKGRYALRVIIDLAEQGTKDYIPLKDIAERQDISKKYLEIIAKDLVKGGIIEGASGKKGGYRLKKPADKISAGEIIKLMEGSIAPVACLADGAEKCPRQNVCKTLGMWDELYKMENDFFYSKKISDFL